jgi:hypothetical protein
VVDHLVERDRQRGGLPLDHHAERVAHEQDIDPGSVEQLREGRVVAGEHGDLVAGRLLLAQGVDGLLVGHSALLPDRVTRCYAPGL